MNGTTERREAAIATYRAALVAGEPLSGAELGRRYGMSPQWGRQVAAEVRAGSNGHHDDGMAAPEPAPAARVEYGPPAWVRALTVAGVLAVAVAAGVASVDHLAALAELAGTTGWRRWLLPAAVDGLAAAAALTLYGQHRGGARAGVLPWVALLAGLGASVVGNVASVYPELFAESHLRIGVGATPPLSLALAVELALRQIRHNPVGYVR